jgi:predicted nuclease with TOPRIM domain
MNALPENDFQKLVLDSLNKLTTDVEKFNDRLNRLTTDVEKFNDRFNKLTTDVEKLTSDNEKFNDRFGNYQQATQWVVQLAFTLIASATITVIITSVLRK